MEGIISFSDVPLRWVGWFGLTVSAVSFVIGLYYLLFWALLGTPLPGFTLIIVSLFFMGGIQLIVLAFIGQYISKIHLEVKQRPLYVIRDLLQ